MDKLSIAQDINFKGKVFRTIAVEEKLNLQVGQEYEFFHEVESWCTEYGQFYVENDYGIQYFFRTNQDVIGHEVNYDNEDECEILDCFNCDNECEVLLMAAQHKFIIKSISTDSDFEEIGYYEVELEVIK